MLVPYPQYTGSEPCLSTDPDAFFPAEVMLGERASTLRRICGNCPTREPCLTWALHHEPEGFWGGMTPNERKQYRRKYGLSYESLTWPYSA